MRFKKRVPIYRYTYTTDSDMRHLIINVKRVTLFTRLRERLRNAIHNFRR